MLRSRVLPSLPSFSLFCEMFSPERCFAWLCLDNRLSEGLHAKKGAQCSSIAISMLWDVRGSPAQAGRAARVRRMMQ